MESHSSPPSASRGNLLGAVAPSAWIGAVGLACLMLSYWSYSNPGWRLGMKSAPPDPKRPRPMEHATRLEHFPGIPKPPTVPAKEADLEEDDEVLGVLVEGTARAYSLKALCQSPVDHVVNDVIHEVPVTVTFCNVTFCAKAFTETAEGKPLKIDGGGLADGKMLILAEGQLYYQHSLEVYAPDSRPSASVPAPGEGDKHPVVPVVPPAKSFPYATFPAARVKWKAWREGHPDTDVYVGRTGRK